MSYTLPAGHVLVLRCCDATLKSHGGAVRPRPPRTVRRLGPGDAAAVCPPVAEAIVRAQAVAA